MVNMNTPICTIKERCCAITCILPYKALPNQVLIWLLHFVVMWINNMPSASGISTQYSPRELILRMQIKNKQHCRALFGSYCETIKN
jgi:hypothetical protein